MSDQPASTNKREHQRYAIDRGVDIYDGERRRTARLKDISGGGAAVTPDDNGDVEDDDGLQAGRYVDLDVEDMGYYGAEVIRELEEGYAVRFDMDDDERGELITEIMEHGITMDD